MGYRRDSPPNGSDKLSYNGAVVLAPGDTNRPFRLSATYVFVALLSQPASAHDASFYDWQNDRLRIAIAQMRFEKTLAEFTRLTC